VTPLLCNWIGSQVGPIWVEPRWSGEGVRGLFSFRLGGFSQPPYHWLNVGGHVGDNPDAVAANRRVVARRIGGSVEEFALAEQVHGDNITCVRAEWLAQPVEKRSPFPACDALITDVPGVTLAIFTADCIPVLLFDPHHRVVAAVHSGWRGTVAGISGKVIERMCDEYGCRPEEIWVTLGPSIRRCCYEVDERVAELLKDRYGSRHVMRRPRTPGKFLVSLQSCVRQDLLEHGVRAEQIEDCGVCTSCRNDVLFSHRADAGKTGRMLGAVRISPPAGRTAGK
jgi:YfiH family protein